MITFECKYKLGFMKKNIFYTAATFFMLHVVTIISLIPWVIKSLTLEKFGVITNDQLLAETTPYFIAGFIIATLLSVIILILFFRIVSRDKKIIVAINISFIYLILSVTESRIDDYMFTLSSSAYAKILESYIPYITIPILFLILVIFSLQIQKK